MEAVIGRTEERCRHRSERPFIPALGRWTPRLISNKGNFSILQPVYSDTATSLGFYYFISPASFLLLCWRILHTLTGVCFTFSLWTFSLCARAHIHAHTQWERERGLPVKSFAFQQRGLWVFVRFFGSVEFLCWSEKHGSAIVQDSWKCWNRGWKARRGGSFTHQDQRTGKWYFNIRQGTIWLLWKGREGGSWALGAPSARNCGWIERVLNVERKDLTHLTDNLIPAVYQGKCARISSFKVINQNKAV